MFCTGVKGVLYEAINSEHWNWRALHLRVVSKACRDLCFNFFSGGGKYQVQLLQQGKAFLRVVFNGRRFNIVRQFSQ